MRGMCPHCGKSFYRGCRALVMGHDNDDTGTYCDGSMQNWRDPDADGRPLWNGKANPHYYRNESAS